MNRKILVSLSLMLVVLVATIAIVMERARAARSAPAVETAFGVQAASDIASTVSLNDSHDKPATAAAALLLPLAADASADVSARDVFIAAEKARLAPALAEGTWLNSEPTTLETLRGKVVLVDFWTYGCYNCINTLPALKKYYAKYGAQGFTIIGVETPEFDAEKIPANLRRAVAKYDIKYPVITDYNADTWRAYGVEAWPTIIIVDKQGRIRYTHIGEGAYDMQERVIKALLAEK